MNDLVRKIYRFKITLLDIEPEVWREIELPQSYNFWELHVAIQDSFGWLDYHLHQFTPTKQNTFVGKPIGIPESINDNTVILGWNFAISDYFLDIGEDIIYEYDFGDNWLHKVSLTGIFLEPQENNYPLCTAGKRACPPEDCGGIEGYQKLLSILSNPEHEQLEFMTNWLKEHQKNYWPYSPEEFLPEKVKFTNPIERWNLAFNS